MTEDGLRTRCNRKPRPTCKKAETPDGGNRSEPAKVCERHGVQTAAKNENTRKQQPPCTAVGGGVKRKHQKRKRVNEMIKHGFVPHVEHAMCLERLPEAVRAEGTQTNGEKTKGSCNSEK